MYLHTYLSTYILMYLCTYLLTYVLTYVLTYLLMYLHTYLYTYALTYLLTYLIFTYVHNIYLYTCLFCVGFNSHHFANVLKTLGFCLAERKLVLFEL